MTAPLVSVCLPNLNTRPFLQERVDTIRAQSYPHWELVVSDNHSEDGAWEFFEQLARSDPRVSIAQAPREGMYANWNRCLERARGDYVYIATSDDTMAPDCLELLVAALERHPECDVAHCPLKPIDGHGRDLANTLWQGSIFATSSGPLLHRPHIRMAPYDGLLHLLGGSVYFSITQLLIRRSLFDRVGRFESTWGSLGDFNWDMRAGLVANTVHVPATWGGWRVHTSQATAGVAFGSAAHARAIDAMIDHAVAACRPLLAPALGRDIGSRWLPQAAAARAFTRDVAARARYSFPRRAAFIAGKVCSRSAAAREYVSSRLMHRPLSDWVVSRWESDGLGPRLVPVIASAPLNGRRANPVHGERTSLIPRGL